MSEEIRQIAERLVGLRDALDLRPEDIASTCNIDLETYLGYESGEKDIPVSFLHQIAKHYGVELPALMFGYEPRMNSYFLTRKDKGVAVERTKAYKSIVGRRIRQPQSRPFHGHGRAVGSRSAIHAQHPPRTRI